MSARAHRARIVPLLGDAQCRPRRSSLCTREAVAGSARRARHGRVAAAAVRDPAVSLPISEDTWTIATAPTCSRTAGAQRGGARCPGWRPPRDLVVEVADDGFCGAVVGVASGLVELEDRHGRRRLFPLGPGFLIDGGRRRPRAADHRRAPREPRRTASGSFAARGRARAHRRARAGSSWRAATTPSSSRRCGATTCARRASSSSTCRASTCSEAALDAEPPSAERRYGVLVDHLVPGSKESRIAATIARGRHGRARARSSVTRRSTSGSASPRARWASRAGPRCLRGTDFKVGVCRALGWPAATRPTSRGRGSGSSAACHSYRDLEPALLGRVEELIDFVTG